MNCKKITTHIHNLVTINAAKFHDKIRLDNTGTLMLAFFIGGDLKYLIVRPLILCIHLWNRPNAYFFSSFLLIKRFQTFIKYWMSYFKLQLLLTSSTEHLFTHFPNKYCLYHLNRFRHFSTLGVLSNSVRNARAHTTTTTKSVWRKERGLLPAGPGQEEDDVSALRSQQIQVTVHHRGRRVRAFARSWMSSICG